MIKALERLADANEAIVRLATEERETFDSTEMPVHCPWCGTLDPEIQTQGGDGHFSEFALVAQCKCGQKFVALAKGWNIGRTVGDIRERD